MKRLDTRDSTYFGECCARLPAFGKRHDIPSAAPFGQTEPTPLADSIGFVLLLTYRTPRPPGHSRSAIQLRLTRSGGSLDLATLSDERWPEWAAVPSYSFIAAPLLIIGKPFFVVLVEPTEIGSVIHLCGNPFARSSLSPPASPRGRLFRPR